MQEREKTKVPNPWTDASVVSVSVRFVMPRLYRVLQHQLTIHWINTSLFFLYQIHALYDGMSECG